MLRTKFIKFVMSILNWQVNSCSNFESFLIVTTHNSPVNFRLIFSTLDKRAQKVQIFRQTCSGENLPNSSCYFWKHKSVFLQTLHQYLVPLKITPLYLFSWKFIYFQQKKPIKVEIWWTFTWVVKIFLKICTSMGSFCKNYIKFQPKKYRWVLSHDIEERCKI